MQYIETYKNSKIYFNPRTTFYTVNAYGGINVSNLDLLKKIIDKK